MNLLMCALIVSLLAPTIQRPSLLIGTWNVESPITLQDQLESMTKRSI